VNKKFRCSGCRQYFDSSEAIQLPVGRFHSIDCAIAKANKIKEAGDKKEHTAKKRKLKDEDRSFQLKKTQQIFNKYIRIRDRDDPCISCGRHHSGQYHAGHYRTVGANPELRFHEWNCHKQCSACNNHLSGNLVNYRISLIDKLGSEHVQMMEGHHPAKRYTIDNLKTIQRWYKRKIKRLEKGE
jgi:hypothetical protein